MRRSVVLGSVLVFLLSSLLLGAPTIFVPNRAPGTPEVLILRDLRDGKITQRQAANYRALLLFKPTLLPTRYSAALSLHRRTCGASDMINVFKSWKDLSAATRLTVPANLRPTVKAPMLRVVKGTIPANTIERRPLPAAKAAAAQSIFAPDINQNVYTTTNFRIHWNTTGSDALVVTADSDGDDIPDMVETAADSLETTWTWFKTHGFRLPPGTDTYYYDFYFGDNSGTGFLAYALPIEADEEDMGLIPPRTNHYSTSFILMGTQLSGEQLPGGTPASPMDACRTVASHEFFHAVQFGYNDTMDNWWMESCAKWFETQPGPQWEALYSPAIWIKEFLFYPEVGLDDPNWDSHWYMSSLWPTYLQTHLSPDATIIREIWEACDTSTSGVEANNIVLSRYLPGGFGQAYRDFLIANLEADYPAAKTLPHVFDGLWYDLKVHSYPHLGGPPVGRYPHDYPGSQPVGYYAEGLGATYLVFSPMGGGGNDLVLNVTAPPANWIVTLVRKVGDTFQVHDSTPGVIFGIEGFTDQTEDAVLILSPVVASDSNQYVYDIDAQLMVADLTPPTPSPMTWLIPPFADSPTSISMACSLALDADNPPCTYSFFELSGNPGGADSGWLDFNDYTNSGLTPNTLYTYQAEARDSSPAANQTGLTDPYNVYTLCNVPNAPILSNPSPTKVFIAIGGGDGNPADTQYAVYNVTTATYVAANGSATILPFFTTAAGWTAIRVKDLVPATTYAFEVKARNHDEIETVLGPSGFIVTLPADAQAPVVSNTAIVPALVREGQTRKITLTASTSDAATGSSDIVQAEYYLGAVDPGQGHATAMNAADGAFDSAFEAITVDINVSTWLKAQPPGPYDLHVRCRDEAGNWSSTVLEQVVVGDTTAPNAVADLSAVPAPGGDEPVIPVITNVSSEDPANPATNVFDGDPDTYWATLPTVSATSESMTVDLGASAVYDTIALTASSRTDLFPSWFRITLGDGADTWTAVAKYDFRFDPLDNQLVAHFAPRVATQMTVEILQTVEDQDTQQYSVQIAEIALQRYTGGAHKVNLTWSAPLDLETPNDHGPAVAYMVKYSTDKLKLASDFDNCTTPLEAPPTPGDPGPPAATDSMSIAQLDAGTTYSFALKSVDAWDNVSQISNIATTSTLDDPYRYIGLDSPQDGASLSVTIPPTFAWHANGYDRFTVELSNVPWFPSAPMVDKLKRTARTLKFASGTKLTSFTPTVSQWKQIKTLAAGMDGTLYWMIVGRSSAAPSRVSESVVFHAYGFDLGGVLSAGFSPNDGSNSIWPSVRPQFSWTVGDVNDYSRFFLDFSASPDTFSVFDKAGTVVIPCAAPGRRLVTWFRPTAGDWKKIKQTLLAGAKFDQTGGVIYWRLRALDTQGAYSVATDPQPLVLLQPAFDLALPEPNEDGTIDRGLPFTLNWDIGGAMGYPFFRVQFSTSDSFPAGSRTINMPVVKTRSLAVSASTSTRIAKLYDAGGAAHLYWRVVAYEVDKVFSVDSDPQELTVVTPPGN